MVVFRIYFSTDCVCVIPVVNYLFSEVVSPGQTSYLLLPPGGLFRDPHVSIRDDVKSVPRSPLAHNVLA